MERQDQIHNAVQRPLLQNQEMTPHEYNFGKMVIFLIYTTLDGTRGYTIEPQTRPHPQNNAYDESSAP